MTSILTQTAALSMCSSAVIPTRRIAAYLPETCDEQQIKLPSLEVAGDEELIGQKQEMIIQGNGS